MTLLNKILQKLYRIHTKFRLVIDEDIEVDRDKINQMIKQLGNTKDKKNIFEFGDKPEIDEYDGRIERKLKTSNYDDKWIYIQEWFQILETDNQELNIDQEETKDEFELTSEEPKYTMRVSLLQLK